MESFVSSYIHRAGNSLILRMESWFNAAFSNLNNPFYHLGSLSFFLFMVVLVSGIVVFIPFETSLRGAYSSVEWMTTTQWWFSGLMRSVHRYASDAAMITILLHMFREFFRDRYRGIRWFSWFTGVPSLWLVVVLGISGYWLVWDMMAQYVAISTAELVDWLPVIPSAMVINFLDGEVTDRFFTLMAFLHLAGFPVALVFGLWIHVSRISKVDLLPPRTLAIGTMISLTLLSILHPAISHEAADLTRSPITLNLDWFYLNIYPIKDILGSGAAWGVAMGFSLLLSLLPWLPPKKEAPAAQVDLGNCSGCGGCARDCPFGAATMQPRTDGINKPFQSVIDASLCTACGICVGACGASNPFRKSQDILKVGVFMPNLSLDTMRTQTDAALHSLQGDGRILIFGCDFGCDLSPLRTANTAVVTLPCIGMLPPSFIDYALKNGADGVLITGCREGDCYYRIGNTLITQRIHGQREPSLIKRTDRNRLDLFWAGPPDGKSLAKQLAVFRKAILGMSDPDGMKTPAVANSTPKMRDMTQGEAP